MRRLLFSLLCSALLAGPISAQAPASPQDTLAYTTTSVRLREKPFATARALAVLPQGTGGVGPIAHADCGWQAARGTYGPLQGRDVQL